MSHPRSISFVVPVRNDAARLRRCLETISASIPAGVPVEIVVADNGSTDDSAAVARAAGARVLTLPGVRLGALRNAAADAAKGDVLAFVDADHEIAPAWISCAMDTLTQPGVGAVGAPYHPPAASTWVQRLYDRLRRHPVSQEPVEWLGSGNLAVTREAFRDAGGFDTSLEACEDVDLCRKLRAFGYVLLADTRMRSVHHGDPQTLGQVFFGELWRGRDNIRVSLRAPRGPRTIISAALPVATLIALVFVIVGAALVDYGGLLASALALSYLVLTLGLRASAMTRHSPLSDWPKACAVAAAYEAGRALALTGLFGYRRRRRAAA